MGNTEESGYFATASPAEPTLRKLCEFTLAGGATGVLAPTYAAVGDQGTLLFGVWGNGSGSQPNRCGSLMFANARVVAALPIGGKGARLAAANGRAALGIENRVVLVDIARHRVAARVKLTAPIRGIALSSRFGAARVSAAEERAGLSGSHQSLRVGSDQL